MAGHMKDDTEMAMEQSERDHKYQMEDDVRTLTKAEEIKKDKKRYSEACEMMKKQMGMMKDSMGGKS